VSTDPPARILSQSLPCLTIPRSRAQCAGKFVEFWFQYLPKKKLSLE
jgi:hypothetical protein